MLRRAGWKCERRIPGVCTGAASQVSHRRGIANDPGHTDLEAICVACHKVVTGQQSQAARTARSDPAPRPRTQWT